MRQRDYEIRFDFQLGEWELIRLPSAYATSGVIGGFPTQAATVAACGKLVAQIEDAGLYARVAVFGETGDLVDVRTYGALPPAA